MIVSYDTVIYMRFCRALKSMTLTDNSELIKTITAFSAVIVINVEFCAEKDSTERLQQAVQNNCISLYHL